MKKKENGVVLYITLVSLMIVCLLVGFMLKSVVIHSAYSTGKLNRINAFYAVRSALNYVYDRLNYNDPVWTSPGLHKFCNSNPLSSSFCSPGDIVMALPQGIRTIEVNVTKLGFDFRLDARVVYSADKF